MSVYWQAAAGTDATISIISIVEGRVIQLLKGVQSCRFHVQHCFTSTDYLLPVLFGVKVKAIPQVALDRAAAGQEL